MPAPHLPWGVMWTNRRNTNTARVAAADTASMMISDVCFSTPIVSGSTSASIVRPNVHMNALTPLNSTMRRACSETTSVGSPFEPAEPRLSGAGGVSLGTTAGCFIVRARG